ncbi:MAG TPA: twin-arginine translocation signal domain-containing protein, partial [Gemmatimonadaceae bacterium]
MTDPISRRDWLKTVGVASAGAIVSPDGLPLDTAAAPLVSPAVTPTLRPAPGGIIDLTSTGEIFT